MDGLFALVLTYLLVPEKTEFGAGQSEMLLGAGSSKFTVNKIAVSMWIDKSVPDSIVELIKDIAKNVISFKESRGDQIYVKKVDVVAKRFYWSSLFLPPNLFWFILTITGAFVYDADGFERALELLARPDFPSDVLIEPGEVPLAGVLGALHGLEAGDLAGKVIIVPAAS